MPNINRLSFRVEHWLARKLRTNRTFTLREDVILRGRGQKVEDTVRISEIQTWVDYGDPWIFVIPIHLANGHTIEWSDPYCELENILRSVAPDKVTTRY